VVPVDMAIAGDVAEMLAFLDTAEPPDAARVAERKEALARIRQENDYGHLPRIPTRPGTIHYADIMRALDRFLTADDLLALDAGNSRIWATTRLPMRTPGQTVVPGGLGGMGWCTPAATAAKIVRPERRVTGLIGDGGFMMTMDAVATAAERGLDVVWIVANNAGLGMVRDNLGNRRIGVDFADHDFARVAEGLGGSGITVTAEDQMLDALHEAHRRGGPVVIDVKVDPAASHKDCSDYGPL
jgi:acetolactate synthase-1/2/3 large subunit